LLNAGRRFEPVRPGGEGGERLSDLTGRIVGRSHEQDAPQRPVLGMEPETDGHVVKIGDDSRAQERRLADAALAVEDQRAGVGPAEDTRKPFDVVIAAGEKGAVFGPVGGQRQVGLVRQRGLVPSPLTRFRRGGLRDGHRTAAILSAAEQYPLPE
jgi:hypothetical protein